MLALREAVEVLLRLFAPFIPFATEEVWSWTHDGSVHTAAWPAMAAGVQPTGLLGVVGEALIGIRRAKTDAKVSQKTEIVSATISGPVDVLDRLRQAADDLKAVGRIGTLDFVLGAELTVTDIVLAEQVA